MDGFNRDNLKELRENLNKVLKDFGDEHGLVLSFNNISYTQSECSTRLTITRRRGNETAEDTIQKNEKKNFVQNAASVGLAPEDFEKNIRLQNSWFTITGLNLRCKKNPVLIKREDGKNFKCSVADAKMGLTANN